jgi:hypothetical protein
MASTLLLVVGCGIGVVVLGIIIFGVIMLVQAGDKDTVSTARADWISRRSDDDERGW